MFGYQFYPRGKWLRASNLFLFASSSEKLTLVLEVLPLQRLQGAIGHHAALDIKTRLDLTAEAAQEPCRSACVDSIEIKNEAKLTS
jgi:hypothetical protein